MTCKPWDKDIKGSGFCFTSLLCNMTGEKFPEDCLKCFTAAGDPQSNEARR